MKKIILIITAIPFLCAGAFVFLTNSYFNPTPGSMFQIRAANPKWALLMLSATVSAIIGVALIIKATEKK